MTSIPRFRILLAVSALAVALSAGASPSTGATPFHSDRFQVTVQGDGPDVVLVHGLNSSPRVWQGLVQAMPGHRFHLIGLRGFGGLAPGANRAVPLLPELVNELHRYIASEHLVRPVFIGHSLGGELGVALAEQDPQDLGALVIMDAPPFLGAVMAPPGASADSLRTLAAQLEQRELQAGDADWHRQGEAEVAGMVRDAGARPPVLEDWLRSDRVVSAHAFKELMLLDLRPDLPRIACRTALLYVKPGMPGITDEQIDGFYREAYKGVPGIVLRRVSDSGHFLMLDQPERVFGEVSRFLEDGGR
jgi:pimeloyl-ACP methyl ester carboxylesterase